VTASGSTFILGRNEVRLFLTSFAILFVELLLIRWIPANVKYIGFFSNFLLIASFFGIGLGILLGRRGWNPRISLFAVALAAVVLIVLTFQLNVQITGSNEIFFGLAESQAANVNFLILPMVVALVVMVTAMLALPLGPLLKSMPPLKAYAIDIGGSMSGIAAFAVLSALGTNPFVWFLVAVLLVAALDVGRGLSRWAYANAAVLGFTLWLVFTHLPPGQIWSAYYRIDTLQVSYGADCKNMTLEHILVDGIPHQALHPVGQPCLEPIYTQVYRWFPGRVFNNVLIVGAGNGSDAALALANGAQHVDAVEIDPALMQLGIERHPNHPYADPRVSRYINDGRAFLRTTPTDTKWDLVIFALPDSLTLVSSQSAIRLESFLFTEQAFSSVRDHLAPDGIFVLYNYYRQEWLVTKLASMLDDAFDQPPLLKIATSTQATLADGPLVASLPNGQPPGDTITAVPNVGDPVPTPATDDWPFQYLRTPFIADYYLVALAIVLLGALVAVATAARVTGTTIRRFSPHFFVLGTAFLLLTTRSVVSFSLLFGTTWFVNALTFFAILASVLLAIFVNSRWPIRRPTPFYLLLFLSIAIAFLLPPESLLFDPIWLRYIVAAAVAFAPVFFANLVFSYSFRDTATADMAFASNLLGAMVGGALEYLALITGYRALLIVVALLYAGAWLFATRLKRGADRELAEGEAGPPIEIVEAEATV
jgi:SAM-dependent methyltransferase